MSHRQAKTNQRSKLQLRFKGTTLVELMVVVGILAIVGTLGVPSFLSIITKARITSETNQPESCLRKLN
jgi:type IV fimbrial biogenesis protein FimT